MNHLAGWRAGAGVLVLAVAGLWLVPAVGQAPAGAGLFGGGGRGVSGGRGGSGREALVPQAEVSHRFDGRLGRRCDRP